MMKPTSFVVFLAVAGLFVSVPASTFAATAKPAGSDADQAPALTELNEKLATLWSDRPEYVAIVRRTESGEQPPRLVNPVAPKYTKALRRGATGTVLVSFFVDENGRVEAARVLESPDERWNPPTLAAIMKWKFLPAKRGDTPVKASMVVPVEVR